MSDPKKASSQAAWSLLAEGVSSARLDAHRLRHLVNRGLTMVEHSDHRDHLYQMAGDLILAVPQRLDALEGNLDRTTLALIKMGEDYFQARLPLSDKALIDETVQSTAFTGPRSKSSAERIAWLYLQALNRSVQDMVGVKTIVNDTAEKGLPSNTDKPQGPDNPLQGLPVPSDYPNRDRTLRVPQPHFQKPSPVQTQGENASPVAEHGTTGGMTMEVDGEAPVYTRPRTVPEQGEEYGHPYLEQGGRLHQRRPGIVASFDPDLGWVVETLDEDTVTVDPEELCPNEGGGIIPEDVDFILMGHHGVIRALCPETGHVQWADIFSGEHYQTPLEDFFDGVIFMDDDDIDLMFDFLDQEFALDEDEEGFEEDEEDDGEGEIWMERVGVFQVGPVVQRPKVRQRKQRGRKRQKSKRYYLKNRQKIKMRSKKRNRVLRNNPKFKRQRQIRRSKPNLFKRRVGFELGEAGERTAEMDVLGIGKFDDYNKRPNTKPIRRIRKKDRKRYRTKGQRRTQVQKQKQRKPQRVVDYNKMYYDKFKSRGQQKKRAPKNAQLLVMAKRLALEYVATFYREELDPTDDLPAGVAKGVGVVDSETPPSNGGFGIDPHIRSDGSAKVIPYNSDLLNNQGWKTAALLETIEAGISDAVLSRSRALPVTLKRVDPKNAMWTFSVKAGPIPWRDKKSEYKVRVKVNRKGNVRDMEKADFLMTCDCPFWQWQGPEYWAKEGGYLYGKPRGTATPPDQKDPDGEHRLCKHSIAVLGHMRNKGMKVLAPRR